MNHIISDSHYVHYIPGHRILYVGERLVMICYYRTAISDDCELRLAGPTLFTLLTPFKLQSLGRLLEVDPSTKDMLVKLITSISVNTDVGTSAGNADIGELLKFMMQLDKRVTLELN